MLHVLIRVGLGLRGRGRGCGRDVVEGAVGGDVGGWREGAGDENVSVHFCFLGFL